MPFLNGSSCYHRCSCSSLEFDDWASHSVTQWAIVTAWLWLLFQGKQLNGMLNNYIRGDNIIYTMTEWCYKVTYQCACIFMCASHVFIRYSEHVLKSSIITMIETRSIIWFEEMVTWYKHIWWWDICECMGWPQYGLFTGHGKVLGYFDGVLQQLCGFR